MTFKFMSTTTSSSSSTYFLGEEEIFHAAESKIKVCKIEISWPHISMSLLDKCLSSVCTFFSADFL
jgi:hypothetical protein